MLVGVALGSVSDWPVALLLRQRGSGVAGCQPGLGSIHHEVPGWKEAWGGEGASQLCKLKGVWRAQKLRDPPGVSRA